VQYVLFESPVCDVYRFGIALGGGVQFFSTLAALGFARCQPFFLDSVFRTTPAALDYLHDKPLSIVPDGI